MMNKPSLGRALWWAVAVGLGSLVVLFLACTAVTEPEATPTPTRTPRPPTPTPTPVPSPTPTPAWPVTTGCGGEVPEEVCLHLRQAVDEDPEHFTWTEDVTSAEVRLGAGGIPNQQPFATWVYALAAPFFTLEDGVSAADLEAAWTAEAAGSLAEHPLLVSADTSNALRWGPPVGDVQVITASHILTEAVQRDAWAVVPFHDLDPRWKVLRIDGVSPLDRAFDAEAYPLASAFYLGSEERADALRFLPNGFSNRDPAKLSVVMMTGVTALTRGTARTMEREGVLYPARDVRDWLIEPDITHFSNEVSFAEDCPAPTAQSTLTFCSDPSYFELLEHVDADVLELTGNHLLDWGVSAMENSLSLYEERDLPYFGGGWTLQQARRPLTLTHGGHTFGFVGCNPIGPAYAWATAERPGAASCDYELMAGDVRDLRARGIIPIVTFQYWEVDQYSPTSRQQADFRLMAEAGAAIVSGSQAHWPQGFDFHAGAFIHYGLGNLFFDQMQRIEYRQEFLDRHVFYDGRHISTELLTAMLEDYARPRPMTLEERRALLETTFSVSGHWEGAGGQAP
jgi:poly-gamma-glutamate synthesis protein (capsule biosynthesis protein)